MSFKNRNKKKALGCQNVVYELRLKERNKNPKVGKSLMEDNKFYDPIKSKPYKSK